MKKLAIVMWIIAAIGFSRITLGTHILFNYDIKFYEVEVIAWQLLFGLSFACGWFTTLWIMSTQD